MIVEVAHIVAAIAYGAIPILIGFLPGVWRIAAQTFGGEAILRNAVDYALNAVEGAAKDRVLTVEVGSAVLAVALQRVVDVAPRWLVQALGGPAGIREKLFRRLNLEPAASAAALGLAA